MQVNQIFTRRIKSCLKKDSLLVNFIFYIKLLNAPFSSRLRNNFCTHFFLFLLFFFFILSKTTSWKNKMSFPLESDMVSKELQNSYLIYDWATYMIEVRLSNIDWGKLWDMHNYTGAALFKIQRYRAWLVV